MTPLTKSEAQVILDTFFQEVDAARNYLNRNLQDEDHRRERLGLIAGELMRPRTPVEFCAWLAGVFSEALGARAGITMVHEGTWRILGEWESPERLLESVLCGRAQEGRMTEITQEPIKAQSKGTPSLVHLGIPIFGEQAIIAVVLLDTVYSIGKGIQELILAITGTAGVLLEQGLQLQMVSRDEVTGFLSGAIFQERVQHFSQSKKTKGKGLLLGFRTIGVESIREARGEVSAQRAKLALANGIDDSFPRTAILGSVAEDIFVYVPTVASENLELTTREYLRLVNQQLAGEANSFGLRAAAVYTNKVSLQEHLASTMIEITRSLNRMHSGGLLGLD